MSRDWTSLGVREEGKKAVLDAKKELIKNDKIPADADITDVIVTLVEFYKENEKQGENE